MNWIFYIILYLIFSVIFNQGYKMATKNMKNAGALTIILELLAGMISLLFIPLFQIKFPTNLNVYIFLGLAIIFYTLNDRLGTTVRSGIEASTYSIIKQLSTVFMIAVGIIFFKEEIILKQLIGAFLIVISNVLVFYKKGSFKLDKYIALGIVANLCFTIALLIDVSYSEQFNLPFYVATTLSIPALLIFIFERIKLKDIKEELSLVNKKWMTVTSLAWSITIISELSAYQLEKVSIVAPICALSVILNVIVGSLFLNEKDNMLKKIIASVLIIFGIILIKI